jgi:hypothetical protein
MTTVGSVMRIGVIGVCTGVVATTLGSVAMANGVVATVPSVGGVRVSVVETCCGVNA